MTIDLITNKDTIDKIQEFLNLVGVKNIEELKDCIVKSGEMYIENSSFYCKRLNFVYQRKCGKRNKHYRP